jgi:hypothetical protein
LIWERYGKCKKISCIDRQIDFSESNWIEEKDGVKILKFDGIKHSCLIIHE